MASSVSHNTQYQLGSEDVDDMYTFRNGKGEVLQTPKRSSVAGAKALLESPPKALPGLFTVAGSEWPVVLVVRAQSVVFKELVCML